MRILLSFAWSFAFALAQPQPRPNPLEQIERQEQRLLASPDDVPTRIGLLRAYFSKPVGLAPQNIQDARRRHILWLIEHHPDQAELRQPFGMPDPSDTEAEEAWSAQSVKPDAAPKALANAAAFFLQIKDVAKARALIDAGWRAHPENPDVAIARGQMDVLVMVGAAHKENIGQITIPDPASARSPDASEARREIESSADASLLGGAARQLSSIANFLAGQAVLGDEDPLLLALKWSKSAHEIDPRQQGWTEGLMSVYQTLANVTVDARGKIQWQQKALALATTDALQLNGLPTLMVAELDAGDDDGADRDARKLLALAEANPKRGNHDDLVHAAHTVLGGVALDRGDVPEAKDHLLQSVRVKGSGGLASGGPRLTLAQELYDRGEHDAVIRFLEACRSFWTYDQGKLDHYLKLARSGAREVFANWSPPGMALVGQPAPPLKLRDAQGKDPTLNWTPGKTFGMVFWNPSCRACADQIAAYAKEASALDMPMLLVSTEDTESGVRDFEGKNHLSLPVAAGGKDTARVFEADIFPTLVVIDRDGRVVGYRAGSIPPGQVQGALKSGVKVSAPVPLTAEDLPGKIRLVWSPVEGAQSYVVEWEPRDEKGWPSDRDGLLRVIPTREPEVELDGGQPLRWRVYAVNRSGAGTSSAWQKVESK